MLRSSQLVGFGVVKRRWAASRFVFRQSDVVPGASYIDGAGVSYLASATRIAALDKYGNVTLTFTHNIGAIAALTTDGSGNIYATSGANVVKFNSAGVIQWQKTMAWTNQTVSAGPKALALNSSGNLCIGFALTEGIAPPFNKGSAVVCLDPSGTVLWGRVETGQEGGGCYDFSVSASGNVIAPLYRYQVSGFVEINNSGTGVLGKSDSNAATQFNAGISHVDSSGNIYWVNSGTVSKFNAAGTLQWTYAYSAGFQKITTDASGNIYGASVLGLNLDVTKLDSSGTVVAVTRLAFDSGHHDSIGTIKWADNSLLIEGATRAYTVRMPDTLAVSGKYDHITFAAGSSTKTASGLTFGSTSLPTSSAPSASTPSFAVSGSFAVNGQYVQIP